MIHTADATAVEADTIMIMNIFKYCLDITKFGKICNTIIEIYIYIIYMCVCNIRSLTR